MADDTIRFELFVCVDGAGPTAWDYVEHASRLIADDLRSLPGLTVKPLHSSVEQPGAKALDGNLVGLLVAISGAGALLPTAISVLRDWIVREPPTTKISIKFGETEISWDGATPPAEVTALLAHLADRK